MPKNQFYLITTRRFLPLFITQFFGAFNDTAFKAALSVLIAYVLITDTHHAQLLVNLAGGAFTLPFFLFSATAGQLADKFRRVPIVQIIKCCEILFMILGGIGFYFANIPVLMITLFLMGTHSAFFGPIKYSLLPDLLYPKELLGGNALFEASTFIVILIATIIGTTLGASIPGAITMSMICIALAVVGLTGSLFIPSIRAADPTLKINVNFLQEIWRIVVHLRKFPQAFIAIIGISWFWFLGYVLLTQLPIYTKVYTGGNEHVVALFLTTFSVGIAIGALLCNKLLKGTISAKFVPIGVLVMSLFIFDWVYSSKAYEAYILATPTGIHYFLSSLAGWRIWLDMLFFAIAAGNFIVPLYAIMQTQSTPEYRSRTIAANNILNAFFMVIATVLVMALVAVHVSTLQIFLLIGIINILIALYLCKLLPESTTKSLIEWLRIRRR